LIVEEGARSFAEKIMTGVDKMEIAHAGNPAYGVVTISLGVATLDAGSLLSHEDLLKRADRALYAAKEKGRNSVEFFL
jgi:diguanylate cyclase (GGDEF)-like protein